MNSGPETLLRNSRKALENPYAYLSGAGNFEVVLPDGNEYISSRPADNSITQQPVIDSASIYRKPHKDRRLSDQKIEHVVRSLQNKLWLHRSELFPTGNTMEPADVLDPLVALNGIGYQSETVESLGRCQSPDEIFEVAGMIDGLEQKVFISRQFPLPIRNFTAAHELGHAILHKEVGLHRDRPLDGGSNNVSRERIEIEADIFAAYFLMPETLVRARFKRHFKTQQFILNEETAFALGKDMDTLQATCTELRRLSKLLAKTSYYDGESFRPLSEQFKVSSEAMAIRLEELKLISY